MVDGQWAYYNKNLKLIVEISPNNDLEDFWEIIRI